MNEELKKLKLKKLMNKISILILILLSALILSCGQKPSTPKPKGYFRIDFPKHEYKIYDDDCPFKFELPVYSFIIKEREEYCWMDFYFPVYKATIYLTYKQVNNNLVELLDDNHEFIYKHTVKADAINERRFENDSLRVYGFYYELKGNTATPVQFFLTDSINHFIRGSLYFSTSPNKDSLKPVIDFISEDIIHFMESFRWK